MDYQVTLTAQLNYITAGAKAAFDLDIVIPDSADDDAGRIMDGLGAHYIGSKSYYLNANKVTDLVKALADYNTGDQRWIIIPEFYLVNN